jgi:hypothetical protein
MSEKPVSLSPLNFSDDGGLLDLSLAEVVSLLQDKEKQRRKLAKDDDNQQEDIVGCKSVPTGLMMALDGNARRLDVSRAILTRCASHQIATWLDSLDRIREITGLYNIACDAAEEYGYPDLYEHMAPNYGFSSSDSRPVSFRTIRWIKNKLYSISQPVGVPAGSLFIVGLCYSLTRAGNETKGTIKKYLSSEVEKFVRHVDERAVWVVGFNDLVRRRARDEGLEIG